MINYKNVISNQKTKLRAEEFVGSRYLLNCPPYFFDIKSGEAQKIYITPRIVGKSRDN
jgi:hypothetical protein